MNGLEIIECIPVEQVPDSVLFCFLLGTFSTLIPTFIAHKLTKNFSKVMLTELIAGIIYLVFGLSLLTCGAFEKPTGEYQYKVNITKEVGYIELIDKYYVIAENDDGTYIIQEKTA